MYLVFMEVSLHGDMMYVRNAQCLTLGRVLLLYRDSLAQELSYSAANTHTHTHTHTLYTHVLANTCNMQTCMHSRPNSHTHTAVSHRHAITLQFLSKCASSAAQVWASNCIGYGLLVQQGLHPSRPGG